MPSRSIFLSPLWAPRMRRRSTGVRRTPVISHVRQVSFVAPGSTWFSATGISQYSAVLETPAASKAPERESVRRGSPGSLDLQDARLRRGNGYEAVEHLKGAVLVDPVRQSDVSGCAIRENEGRCAENSELGNGLAVIPRQPVEESRRPEDERTQVVEEDVEGDGFCRGHAECSNATPPDAYSRQLVLDASGPPRPAAAIHRRLCSHLRREQ